MNALKKQKGFTLIEVGIVIAIIGILVAIAIPSYDRYMKKVTRKQMTVRMQEIALILEKNYSICERYNLSCSSSTKAPFGSPSPWDSLRYPDSGRSWHYRVTVDLDAHDFVITATPNVGSKQEFDSCQSLRLDSQGVRFAGAADGALPNINDNNNCWN